MDYASDAKDKSGQAKYPKWIIRDAKWVWPILVMFLPITFFFALFEMQGSRWILQGRIQKIKIKSSTLRYPNVAFWRVVSWYFQLFEFFLSLFSKFRFQMFVKSSPIPNNGYYFDTGSLLESKMNCEPG